MKSAIKSTIIYSGLFEHITEQLTAAILSSNIILVTDTTEMVLSD